jgi:hypothetical protein
MTDLIIKQIQLVDSGDTVELFLHDSSGKGIYFDHCKETVSLKIFTCNAHFEFSLLLFISG